MLSSLFQHLFSMLLLHLLSLHFYEFAHLFVHLSLEVGRTIFFKSSEATRSDSGVVGSMIQMYVKCGQPQQALHLWQEWKQKRRGPTEFLYTSVVSACTALGESALPIGNQVHTMILRDFPLSKQNIHLVNTLLNMHTKCGNPDMALQMFSQIAHLPLDKFTYSTLLQACGEVGTLQSSTHWTFTAGFKMKIFLWTKHCQTHL